MDSIKEEQKQNPDDSFSDGEGSRNSPNSHNKKKFPCSICKRSFSKTSSLQRHVEAVHQNHRPLTCSFGCGYKTNQRCNLTRHEQTHLKAGAPRPRSSNNPSSTQPPLRDEASWSNIGRYGSSMSSSSSSSYNTNMSSSSSTTAVPSSQMPASTSNPANIAPSILSLAQQLTELALSNPESIYMIFSLVKALQERQAQAQARGTSGGPAPPQQQHDQGGSMPQFNVVNTPLQTPGLVLNSTASTASHASPSPLTMADLGLNFQSGSLGASPSFPMGYRHGQVHQQQQASTMKPSSTHQRSSMPSFVPPQELERMAFNMCGNLPASLQQRGPTLDQSMSPSQFVGEAMGHQQQTPMPNPVMNAELASEQQLQMILNQMTPTQLMMLQQQQQQQQQFAQMQQQQAHLLAKQSDTSIPVLDLTLPPSSS